MAFDLPPELAALDAELEERIANNNREAAAMHDPCYRCACCKRWASNLEQLRGHVVDHDKGDCRPNCLVCMLREGQW